MFMQPWSVAFAGEKLRHWEVKIKKEKEYTTIKYMNHIFLGFKKYEKCNGMYFNDNFKEIEVNPIKIKIDSEVCLEEVGLLRSIRFPLIKYNYKYSENVDYLNDKFFMYLKFSKCIEEIEFSNNGYNFILNNKECNEKLILSNYNFKINGKVPEWKENVLPYFEYKIHLILFLIILTKLGVGLKVGPGTFMVSLNSAKISQVFFTSKLNLYSESFIP